MRRNHLINLLFLLLLLAVAACGTARRGETVREEPLPLNEANIASGQKLYMTYCDRCHPGGHGGLGPAINNKPLPGFMIKLQVRRGFGVMPRFSKEVISEEQLDDVVAYLVALRRLEVDVAQR